jgi:acetyltransferase-like isoleucine patch superfamily enzyme
MLPYREGPLFKVGLLMDHYAYSKILRSFGEDTTVHPSVEIRHPQNVSIGCRTSVNHGSELHGAGGIEIGDGTLISFNVMILSDMREFRNRGAIGEQPKVTKTVRVGSDAWIGAGAIVLPGVTIGDHAIVGAGAVVTRDVEEWEIVAGNPARHLGSRLDREYKERS